MILYLFAQKFGGLGIDKIMTGLLLNKNICENINLVQLDLSNCNITYITPQFLACTKFRFIEKFDFSYNRLADDAQVKLFFNQLTNLPILAHLNITEINITSKTCKQLRNYLELSKVI
jgi:Leucine-rich repeat (LRR) protein